MRHVKPGSKMAFKKPVVLHKQVPKMEVDNTRNAVVDKIESTSGEPTLPSPNAPPSLSHSPPPSPGHADDFRPTAPGHSPGIGHSIRT